VTWDKKYWDLIHKLYWEPRYLGLDPISEKEMRRSGVLVCVSKEFLGSRRLRRRTKTEGEVFQQLGQSEDSLNVFFDITFGIAPDTLINSFFCRPLGIDDNGPFRSLSLLEVTERYEWGQVNVTQHDSFFISDRSIFFVELKLNAPTSMGQILKYAALIVLEEELSGKRQNVGLLYIVPEESKAQLWNKCGLDGPVMTDQIINEAMLSPPNATVKSLVLKDKDRFADALSRMRLASLSWTQLHQSVCAEIQKLDQTDTGQQTLHRLLMGFHEQLRKHGDTGIDTGNLPKI
jgi:hypothetical protein